MKALKDISFIFVLAAGVLAGQTISGVVTDPQARAVAGASVSMVAQDGDARRDTTSDASGAYRFERVVPGEYVILAQAPWFSRFVSAHVRVAREQNLRPAAYTGDGSIAYFFRRSGTKIRAHAGRGYRAPSPFERFGAGFDETYGYTVYGDPRLRPERSIGIDGGFDQSFWKQRARLSATYFYTRLQDVIIFTDSIPADDPYDRSFGYANSKGGLSRGVEMSARVTPTASLSLTGSYTPQEAASADS